MAVGWIFAANSKLRSFTDYTPPKEIFHATCDELARYFERDGLRYVRSRPRLEHKRGDLTLKMAMWSSRANSLPKTCGLEVVAVVFSKELGAWIKKTGVGRNNALFSVSTKNPKTGTHNHSYDVWGIKPKQFVEVAESIREWSWSPMDCIGADGSLPATLHPRLEPVVDNYACWLMMRGEKKKALAIPDLEPELVTQLRKLG